MNSMLSCTNNDLNSFNNHYWILNCIMLWSKIVKRLKASVPKIYSQENSAWKKYDISVSKVWPC